MRNQLVFLVVGIFLTGCAITGEKTKLAEKENPSLRKTPAEIDIAQVKAIADTSLEISKNAEDIAKKAVDSSRQAEATSDKALEAANKAIESSNNAIKVANEAADRAIAAAEAASRKAIAAANDASDKAIAASNEAVTKANEARDRSIAAANQAITEANQMRATVKMAPPDEPIIQKEPVISEGKTYTVKKGDTLSGIASKMYGDSGKWHLIYQANKQKIKSPNSLAVGRVLNIP